MPRLLFSKSMCFYFLLIAVAASGFVFAVLRPDRLGFYAFIAVAALGGFGVAAYIFRMKRNHGTLVCPMGSECNVVVTSRYSKFLGIKLEHMGMAYFTVIFFSYLALIFTPQILPPAVVTGIILLTMGAAAFSLYLLFVQAFLLRNFCIWCLLASFLSLSIFVAAFISIEQAVAFLGAGRPALEAIASLGLVLGMGGSIIAAFMFSRFLNDQTIDDDESEVLKKISELAWVGFALVLIGHLAHYVGDAATLVQSGFFLITMLALFVLGIAGAALIILFAPFLSVIPFTAQNEAPLLAAIRRPTFIVGAVALASWSFIFIAQHVPGVYPAETALMVYGAIVAIAVMTALIWEHRLLRRSTKDAEPKPQAE